MIMEEMLALLIVKLEDVAMRKPRKKSIFQRTLKPMDAFTTLLTVCAREVCVLSVLRMFVLLHYVVVVAVTQVAVTVIQYA